MFFLLQLVKGVTEDEIFRAYDRHCVGTLTLSKYVAEYELSGR